jgi:DNA repair protein RadA/Sms
MKTRRVYVCTECGAKSHQWQGQCAGCGAWNSLTEHAEAKPAAGAPGRRPSAETLLAENRPAPLAELRQGRAVAYSSGLDALDEVLGKGFVPGGVVLLAGEPGIGKSTLLLQLVGNLARTGRSAVYVSAEESLGQIRGRAERLGLLSPDLLAMAPTRAEDALAAQAPGHAPDQMVVDSVQPCPPKRWTGCRQRVAGARSGHGAGEQASVAARPWSWSAM